MFFKTKSASCIAAGEEHIYVGCAEGVVRVFSTGTLSFVTSLPHPHFLGVEVATATTSRYFISWILTHLPLLICLKILACVLFILH